MPLQLFAFSRLHILTKLTRYRNLYNVVIVGSCAMMLTGILYLAQHRGMWINYEIKFMDNKDLILTEPPPKGKPPKK